MCQCPFLLDRSLPLFFPDAKRQSRHLSCSGLLLSDRRSPFLQDVHPRNHPINHSHKLAETWPVQQDKSVTERRHPSHEAKLTALECETAFQTYSALQRERPGQYHRQRYLRSSPKLRITSISHRCDVSCSIASVGREKRVIRRCGRARCQ